MLISFVRRYCAVLLLYFLVYNAPSPWWFIPILVVSSCFFSCPSHWTIYFVFFIKENNNCTELNLIYFSTTLPIRQISDSLFPDSSSVFPRGYRSQHGEYHGRARRISRFIDESYSYSKVMCFNYY